MKILDVYKQIIDVAKKQLFASVAKDYAYIDLFREQLYLNNVSRFSIQSTVVALMDTGLLLMYILNRLGPGEASPPYVGVLLVKIALMALCSYGLARMSNRPYDPASPLHRHIDVLYPVMHAVGELAIFLVGPQDLGAFIRLMAVPFIVGGIPIINQVKSITLLVALQLFVFLLLPQTAYGAFAHTFTTPYSFWLVACACSIFISATVYSWFVNNFTSANMAREAREELAVANHRLEDEVEQRTRLLDVVNSIISELLGSSTENFDESMLSCMGKIGDTVNVDRVYIWKNHMEGDELYCTQTHEWSGGAEAQQGNELTVSVPFPEAWYPNLSANECINGTVSQFPDYEREHLQAQNIVSIIVVPIYVYSEFWGFVGFDDCKSERLFTQVEEAILRSVGLLFATSMVRNDTTARLESATEAALASSRAKTDFLANMSHEIRTPINAITGMSSIARMAQDKDEVDHCLDNIDAASRQLLSIINDVLDMSKIEAGKMELAEEPYDLVGLLHNVQSIIGIQAREKGLKLSSAFGADLPKVAVGDEMRLSQVLLNLLSNAVKFTPNGGRVHFAASPAQAREDGVDQLEFTVQDTGIGISEDQRESLFSKFEQADRGISRRFGGTGLGLSITKSIVELMGGSIELESAPGDGSLFTVRVPVKRGAPEMLGPAEGADSLAGVDFTGRRALLVEDIEINREIVVAMLEETGLAIDEAGDGQQAVDMVAAAPEAYDVIFMDLHMPVMDGYTATREIRAMDHPRAKAVPIVAMTANAFAEDIQKCLDAGMNDHVAKPVDFDELAAKISGLLAGV